MTVYTMWGDTKQVPALLAAASAMIDARQPDAVPSRHWRIELPNLVDDLGLGVYAFRLYAHLKRVCGAAGGRCYESTRTLAAKCGMSTGKVSDAKRELVAAGLIYVKGGDRRDGTADEITITDIWAANHEYFSRLAQQKRASKPPVPTSGARGAEARAVAAPPPPAADGVQVMNEGCSGDETKKQPYGTAQPVLEEGTTTSTAPDAEEPAPVVAPSPSVSSQKRSRSGSMALNPQLEAEVEAVVGSKETARDLIRQYGVSACRQQLEWLSHRSYEDKGAMYATAVRKNYAEPTLLRLQREERERQREKASLAALARKRAEDEARAQAAQAAAVETWYATLSAADRAFVDAEVEREVQHHPMFARMKRSGPILESTRRLTRRKIFASWGQARHHAC